MEIGGGIMKAGEDQHLLPSERAGQDRFDLAQLIITIGTSPPLTGPLEHKEDAVEHRHVMVHTLLDTLHIVVIWQDRGERADDLFGTFWAFLICFNRQELPVTASIQEPAFAKYLEKASLEECLAFDAFLEGGSRAFQALEIKHLHQSNEGIVALHILLGSFGFRAGVSGEIVGDQV